MSNFDRRAAKNWGRLAMNLGLLLTDSKLRSSIGNRVKERVDTLGDSFSQKYEEAIDRMEAATDALQGRSHWPSRLVAMLVGIGIGTGVGILLAPASGSDTRQSLRDKAVDMKNKVSESAFSATGRSWPSVNKPSTGTEG